jgi:hypothetical protein
MLVSQGNNNDNSDALKDFDEFAKQFGIIIDPNFKVLPSQ